MEKWGKVSEILGILGLIWFKNLKYLPSWGLAFLNLVLGLAY